MNHRRRDAPVSHCPQCGGKVNSNLAPPACTERVHGDLRRRQSVYCVHCGERLIIAR
jgi:DNA-directed RNA polymerase subunit RPC12/RpoP